MNMIFGFSGRIGRLQFWLTSIGVIVFYMAAFMAVGVSMNIDPAAANPPQLSPAALAVLVGTLVIGIWVNIAAVVRRYHDRNKSGWWFLICFVPIVGPIWQFIELGFLSGTPGGNDYGLPGQSNSSSGDESGDEDDSAFSANANLDDMIQQRLVERQQKENSAPSTAPLGGHRNVGSDDRPVFGRRT